MVVIFIFLSLAYILSQFFRSFLTVISENLESDLLATPDDLAFSLGLWFVSFAIMQIPVGWALDKHGPRFLILFLLGLIGSIGILVVSYSNTVFNLHVGMTLIGIGFSPVLMTAYFIFTKKFSKSKFSTLAATITGIGSFGLLIGSSPLTFSVEQIGWRNTLMILSSLNFFISIVIFLFLKNEEYNRKKNKFFDFFKVFKQKKIWFIFPLILMCYAPVSGLRGVWLGPYFNSNFDLSNYQIGNISLLMSLSMIVGIFVYGPLDRIFLSRKWIVFLGNIICALALTILTFYTNLNYINSIVVFLIIGFFGMSFPIIVAHGKSFIPDELTGRGLTILNLFAILGAGMTQLFSSYVYDYFLERVDDKEIIFNYVFFIYLFLLLIGLLIYFFSEDNIN